MSRSTTAKISLEDAEFYVLDIDNGHLKPWNIFDHRGVRLGIALVKTGRVKHIKDWFSFCFGELRGFTQHQFNLSDDFKDDEFKISHYDMVEANRRLIEKIVDSISVESCKRYLRENR